MAAFAAAPPVRRSAAFLRPVGDAPCCRRQQAPVAVLETPPPTSLDQLVRSWFSPRDRSGSGRSEDRAAQSEPLSSEISGPFQDTYEITHYLLSTTVVARKEHAGKMKRLLKELKDSTPVGDPESGIVQCAVNQCPDDPAVFIIFERFAGTDFMTKHQKGPAYQKFIREAQPLLEKPLGMHICKEINGKVSQPYHPFGPAGEGGRDDMIYGIGQRKADD